MKSSEDQLFNFIVGDERHFRNEELLNSLASCKYIYKSEALEISSRKGINSDKSRFIIH